MSYLAPFPRYCDETFEIAVSALFLLAAFLFNAVVSDDPTELPMKLGLKKTI